MRAEMTAGEFDLWLAYYRRFGFAADRIEHVTANAGAVAGSAWGARVDPHDLIPRFGPRSPRNVGAKLLAYLDTIPHGTTEVIERGR